MNDTVDQLHITDIYIYRILHTTGVEYTYFSCAHGKFSKIDHMLGYKTSLKFF